MLKSKKKMKYSVIISMMKYEYSMCEQNDV